MSPWGQGSATVDQMLADGRLERVPASPDDVRADLPLCQAIVDAARKVLGQMPPY